MTLAASETRNLMRADLDLAPPGPLRRFAGAVHRAIEKSRRRRILQAMPDYLLKDIGISRSDIESVVDHLVDGRDDPTRNLSQWR